MIELEIRQYFRRYRSIVGVLLIYTLVGCATAQQHREDAASWRTFAAIAALVAFGFYISERGHVSTLASLEVSAQVEKKEIPTSISAIDAEIKNARESLVMAEGMRQVAIERLDFAENLAGDVQKRHLDAGWMDAPFNASR